MYHQSAGAASAAGPSSAAANLMHGSNSLKIPLKYQRQSKVSSEKHYKKKFRERNWEEYEESLSGRLSSTGSAEPLDQDFTDGFGGGSAGTSGGGATLSVGPPLDGGIQQGTMTTSGAMSATNNSNDQHHHHHKHKSAKFRPKGKDWNWDDEHSNTSSSSSNRHRPGNAST